MRIDKIYILSLNPTQETINKILSKLELIKLKQNIPYDIIEGHDGWNLPVPDGVHLWEGFGLGDKTDNEHWKLPMQPGEVGCALSHIKAWHRVATGDEERVLILEEDFTPIKPLSNLPEPNTWWPFQWDFCSLFIMVTRSCAIYFCRCDIMFMVFSFKYPYKVFFYL